MKLLLALLVAVSAQAATTLEVQIPIATNAGVPFNLLVTARSGPAIDKYSLFGVRDVAHPTVNGNVEQIDVVCPELVASATNSGPVCQGSQAILFGNANLPVASWYWRSAEGRVGPPRWESHEQNPLARPGTYLLTVRQANECTATAQTTVTLHQPEVPQVTLSPSCGFANVEATLTNPGAFSNIAWTVERGTIVSGQGTAQIEIAPDSGSEAIWLAIDADETSSGCSAYRFVDEVPVGGPLPSAVVDDATVLCDAAQATIDVTLSGTPPFRLVWSDGVVQENITALATTRTVTNAGAYWVTQLSDAHCSGTASGAAEVGFGERPAIANEPRGTTVRSGESATLTVGATGGGLRYHWYEGRAGDRTRLVSSELDPSFTTPALTRTTSFWVEIENDCGRVESRAATIAVSSTGGKRRASRP